MKKENADQLIRCVKECWWRVLLVLVFPAVAVIAVFSDWPSKEQPWSAIGAIVAAIAVVVALFQLNHAKTDDHEKRARYRKSFLVSIERCLAVLEGKAFKFWYKFESNPITRSDFYYLTDNDCRLDVSRLILLLPTFPFLPSEDSDEFSQLLNEVENFHNCLGRIINHPLGAGLSSMPVLPEDMGISGLERLINNARLHCRYIVNICRNNCAHIVNKENLSSPGYMP
nr:hypothetical protein [Alcaligenes faecalis]